MLSLRKQALLFSQELSFFLDVRFEDAGKTNILVFLARRI